MTEEIKDKTIPVNLQLLINKIESLKLPKECAKIILLEVGKYFFIKTIFFCAKLIFL